MWKWLLVLIIIFTALIIVLFFYNTKREQINEITRIPLQTCPDKEFEGQGDGALFLNGKKYYTESEDWDWIVENCPDYYIYR